MKTKDAASFAEPLEAVAQAISKLKSTKLPVGSDDAQNAEAALDHLGMAYFLLNPDTNPAWS